MHSAVLKEPGKYMLPAPHLRQTLQRFRDVGKKLFLCSNSGFEYVGGGLKYLLGCVQILYWWVGGKAAPNRFVLCVRVSVPSLVMPRSHSFHRYTPTHKPSDDWRDFFDVIIVSAGKPGFFTSDRPFRSIAQATGKIRCVMELNF